MEETLNYVGIDVSKARLDVYIRPLNIKLKVANTKEEITTLVETIKSHNPKLIVIEATGGLETEAIKPNILAVESDESRQLSELVSRRRQLVEMQTAEKNRHDRARGKALLDIEEHLKYLDIA